MKNMVLRALLIVLVLLVLLFAAPSGTVLYDALSEVVPIPLDAKAGYPVSDAGYLDEYTYEDPSITVRIEKSRYLETDYLLARISLADASQIRTSVAQSYYSQKTAVGALIAKRANAVLAINGDYFSYEYTGYMVRQGKRWRNRPDPRRDLLIIDDKGDLHIITAPDEEKVEAFAGNVVNTFNFGPGLVIDGVKTEEIVDNNNAAFKRAQRVVLAQTGTLEYLCLVSEGPEDKNSTGLTLPELRDLLYSLDVINAYNLDGGSSATMVFNDKKINSLPKFRAICDIVCFVSAYQQEAGK